jgi:divalent metal cation (Fe/Co/Zn/Cd) transporter
MLTARERRLGSVETVVESVEKVGKVKKVKTRADGGRTLG